MIKSQQNNGRSKGAFGHGVAQNKYIVHATSYLYAIRSKGRCPYNINEQEGPTHFVTNPWCHKRAGRWIGQRRWTDNRKSLGSGRQRQSYNNTCRHAHQKQKPFPGTFNKLIIGSWQAVVYGAICINWPYHTSSTQHRKQEDKDMKYIDLHKCLSLPQTTQRAPKSQGLPKIRENTYSVIEQGNVPALLEEPLDEIADQPPWTTVYRRKKTVRPQPHQAIIPDVHHSKHKVPLTSAAPRGVTAVRVLMGISAYTHPAPLQGNYHQKRFAPIYDITSEPLRKVPPSVAEGSFLLTDHGETSVFNEAY